MPIDRVEYVDRKVGVVARCADRVAIMYAGKIVEIGTAEEVYYDPRHPYTWGLMQSLPVTIWRWCALVLVAIISEFYRK